MGSLRFILALTVAFGHFGLPLSFPTTDMSRLGHTSRGC
jgi:hypothetical protein